MEVCTAPSIEIRAKSQFAIDIETECRIAFRGTRENIEISNNSFNMRSDLHQTVRDFAPSLVLLTLAVFFATHADGGPALAFPGLMTLAGLFSRRLVPRFGADASATLPSLQTALPEFERELGRARRYERPLTILVLRPASESMARLGANPPGPADARPRLSSQAFTTIGSVLRSVVRETDVVAWDASDAGFVVAIPEADAKSATIVATRLPQAVHALTGVRMRAGIAVFPEHGLIFEMLLATAAATCGGEAAAAHLPLASPAAAHLPRASTVAAPARSKPGAP
jgi:hypothetical protein